MYSFTRILCYALIFLFSPTLLAQYELGKLQSRGDKFLKKGDFDEALTYFSELDSATKLENPLYDYYMGIFYYNSPDGQENGIPHLERYLERTDSAFMADYGHHHVYYILGKLNHLNYNFIRAQECYANFIQSIDQTSDIPEREKKNMTEQVNREIEQCKFGVVAVQNPRHVIIESLGDSINTIYPEYAAIVSQDESMLFFTSRRPREGANKKDKDGRYYEDIYQAKLAKGSLFNTSSRDTILTNGYYFNLVTEFLYTDFKPMGDNINSINHEGSVQLYENDSLLLFYRDSDIWYIPLNGDSLTEPKKLGIYANSVYHEPSLFFSYDGSKLFIVSDRPGGYGGLDLYLSERDPTGKWTSPTNMGPKINTPFDEDAPYLDPDGVTFYFSSKGHSSMGEFDIFRSERVDTSWTSPVNLGYPINTPAEDIFFTMTKRYNRGYYSSGDLKGVGDIDLYRITFSDERDPVAELKGFVKQGEEYVPAKSRITLFVKDSDEEISTETDTISGDYFLLLGHGKKYAMEVETEAFAPYSHQFDIPEQKEYFQLYQEIHHVHLFNSKGDTVGQKITVFNALGEKDSAVTLYNYSEELRLKLKQIGYLIDYDGLVTMDSEVKFYMTFDSLLTLMEQDSTLLFDFPPNTRISFLADDSLNKFTTTSYTELNNALHEELVQNRADEVIIFTATDTANQAVSSDEIDMIKGLFFTVQIGVYSNPVPHSVLYDLTPIFSQITDLGNTRYSTGRYNSEEKAQQRCNQIINIGITDAFVAAYYDGKRITPKEANQIIKKFGHAVLSESH